MSAALSYPPIPRVVTPDDSQDSDRFEIIDGERRELPAMSADAMGIGSDLVVALSNHGMKHKLGKAYQEMLIKLPLPRDRNRRPDVIFVPFSRWARGRALPSTNTWDVLPELCVEVISPSDIIDDLMDRLGEYFEAGVRAVWVVYPRHQQVYLYDTPTSVRVLTRADTLTGEPVLPGFQLALAELFPEPEPPAPASETPPAAGA